MAGAPDAGAKTARVPKLGEEDAVAAVAEHDVVARQVPVTALVASGTQAAI